MRIIVTVKAFVALHLAGREVGPRQEAVRWWSDEMRLLLVARPSPDDAPRTPPRSPAATRDGEARPSMGLLAGAAATHEFRLLIVDDDRLMTDLLPRKLKKALGGHVRILTASDPAEAKRLLEAQRPHAVLSDFNLRADQDGIDVLEQAARVAPDAARVLFSAHAQQEIGSRIDGAAVQGYLEKPLRLDDLVPRIRGLLEQLTGTDLGPREDGGGG